MNYLLDGEITVLKRIWALVVLIRTWIVWFFVVVVQLALFGVIAALLRADLSSAGLSTPPLLEPSKALIKYSLGNREPLVSYVERKKAQDAQRKADKQDKNREAHK